MEPEKSAWYVVFLLNNWGNIVSVIGTGLTIYYAWGAKTAAEAASQAASGAQARIYAVDWVIHFNTVVTDIDALLSKLAHDIDWGRFASECDKLRSHAAVSAKTNSSMLDAETMKRLTRSATQFATISNLAMQISTEDGQSQHARIRKTLSDQRELYSVALLQAKQHAASGKNDR